ncbi:MAG: class I SAM-dependent methyltransferase [Acetobacteraceae bacterium]|nr:class I SAM-dependent methyltransferase [Acetobacteraceae bacterium]
MQASWRLLRGFVPFTPYDYAGRHEACALCGSRESLPLSRHDRRLKRLTTVVCAGCGLVRTDPMPTESELAEYYRHHYRADYQLVGTKPPRRHLKRTRDEAVRRADLLAPLLPPGPRVLDYGSGSGEFLAEGARRGWRVEGVEPGEAYATHAQGLGLTVHPALPEGAGPFDAITSHHVFEHLRDPAAVLETLAAALAPEGVLYLSVPDMGPSQRPAFDRLHFAHVHGFVPATLDLLAARAGLVLDPRVPRAGTTAVYRKGDAAFRPDPTLAARIRAGFNMVDPVRHIVTFGWLAPSLRRWKRDIRDSFARR